MATHDKGKERKEFVSDFRRFFGRGLAVLLPSVLTLWILVQAYLFVDSRVAQPINRGVREAVMWIIPQVIPNDRARPEWFRVSDEQVAQRRALRRSQGLSDVPDPVLRQDIREEEFRALWSSHWYLQFIGLGVAIILIYLAGVMLGGFIGRRTYQRIEGFITRLPFVKLVYPHVKQVVDLILGERPMAFRRVVLVEYPRKGIYSVGFVTGESLKTARQAAGEDVQAVFIPSTPAPFTGFTITVRRREIVDLPISVDEAIRFFITGGVLVPDRQTWDAPDRIEDVAAKAIADRTEAEESA